MYGKTKTLLSIARVFKENNRQKAELKKKTCLKGFGLKLAKLGLKISLKSKVKPS